MIVKNYDKYKVESKSGKLLGTHSTRKLALKQLAAIEINKYRKETY